ncbi:hypothetical protein PAXRUDRAFT_258072 [Paxillus rubicundulus Ve08.2h10]|uniref:Uncharacterized protein n=1 Tax=Paxillus rubicundulus Ve08.2h10 TaxID=930991 RepID=A0A0D0CAL0_9AGAM|nr:hypothetical protein PAXRUDRAFT_258072 [Paxillus rubicundulus Ve08.2h10]
MNPSVCLLSSGARRTLSCSYMSSFTMSAEALPHPGAVLIYIHGTAKGRSPRNHASYLRARHSCLPTPKPSPACFHSLPCNSGMNIALED